MRRRPRVRVEPVQSGGGQERNIRSGTVPAPLCVGLGEACRLALVEKEVRKGHHSTIQLTCARTRMYNMISCCSTTQRESVNCLIVSSTASCHSVHMSSEMATQMLPILAASISPSPMWRVRACSWVSKTSRSPLAGKSTRCL